MAWEEPRFTKTQVDAAGDALARGHLSKRDEDSALGVLNNWRSAHSFPLNTLQVGLRNKCCRVWDSALVAQRLKRTPSIVQKLRRFGGMKLSRMQDIGGCRGVVRDVGQVMRLRDLHFRSSMKHQLSNRKDYINEPKESGYRGVHLIYRYRSDRNETYNGLLIEVQLRSLAQHAWATAVETVGTFLQHPLKSSEGPDKWLRYFTLTGSAFAAYEKTPPVPGTPASRRELLTDIKALTRELDVTKRLYAYRHALKTFEQGNLGAAAYALLDMRPTEAATITLTISAFSRHGLDDATEEYLRVEKEIEDLPGAQAVLVSVDDMASLKRAYPNYFLDTDRYLSYLAKAVA